MKPFQIIIIIILVFMLYYLKNRNKDKFQDLLAEVPTNKNIMTIKKESKCGNLLFTKKKELGDILLNHEEYLNNKTKLTD